MPQREKEVMSAYFMLLNSLEHNQTGYEQVTKVLDELVDLARDHNIRV
jgi:hypothetical protein